MPSALILIADGTEEMEFVITYDVLVRAGVSCTSAFVLSGAETYPESQPVAVCSRGVRIIPDKLIGEIKSEAYEFDALIIPGGAKGADTISKDSNVKHLVEYYYQKGKIIGMICAGSLMALTAGLPRVQLTSHPSVRKQLEKEFEYVEESVVQSKNLITSRGPGTAFPFALKIVSALCGEGKTNEIVPPMVFPPSFSH